MSDLVDKARRMIELLDASDVAGALAMCCDQIQGYVARGWSMDEHIRKHWHGALDETVPLGMADYLARSLPTARVSIHEDEGHHLLYRRWPEILATLA